MLSDIIDVLADPVDGTSLAIDGQRVVSESGHSYDIARQGYVTLAPGSGLKHEGDSAEMIQARETFLAAGHFAPFVETVSQTVIDILDDAEVPDYAHPVIMEVGAGTGYYLSHTLDAVENARGVGIDISVAAAKHLAKAHHRIGSIVADVWEKIPALDNSVDVISVVFAPRNPVEFARVLRDNGEVVTLTPAPGHLDELREPLGIIGVEEDKLARMIEQSKGFFELVGDPQPIEFTIDLDRAAIAAQVGMSPSARHIENLDERVAALPEKMTVTARANLTRLKKA